MTTGGSNERGGLPGQWREQTIMVAGLEERAAETRRACAEGAESRACGVGSRPFAATLSKARLRPIDWIEAGGRFRSTDGRG